MRERTGADVIIEALQQEKVDVLFGYPGGALLDIFAVLYHAPIRFVLTRHEQGAAHAADGYARATGRVGVCIATSGPGATNLVTGLATAYMDSIPMVAITGQVPTAMIGNDAFQESDVTGITRPITKHNYLVKSVDELPVILKEAFYIAATGRPGPVLVDIPKDIQRQTTKVPYPKSIELRGYKPTYEGNYRQIKKAAEMIHEAQRPLLYCGGGVIASDAAAQVQELAHKGHIPVTTTLLGLGVFPEDDALSLKMLGMHGSAYANYAIMETDLIIAIGVRFDDRITGKLSEFAPHAKIIHIDIDPSSISKSVKVDLPIVGDVAHVLKALNEHLVQKQNTPWLKKIHEWKEKYPLIYRDKTGYIKPQYVIQQLSELTKDDAIIVTDVGQHQMWTAQYYTHRMPRCFLSSGGLGTMGYGFPAGIGAKIAFPQRQVVVVSGDGGFQMNIQELATAVQNEVAVIVIIMNNQYLGMVRQWQELFYRHEYAGTCLCRRISCPKRCDKKETAHCPPSIPNFVKVAEAYDATGIRIEKKQDVVPVIKQALRHKKGPIILDVVVEPEENVFPMVPAGASIGQMIHGITLV